MTEQGELGERPKIKTIEDPRKFMKAFYGSQYYKDAYEEFFKGKKLAPDVTEEEKKSAFFDDDKAKFALIKFGFWDLRLKYNPGKYPVGSQQAIGIYVESVADQRKQMRTERLTADEIKALDRLRFAYHSVAAKQLVQDSIVPSAKLGRAFCRLILVDKKLDTSEVIEESDLTRIEREIRGELLRY